MPGGCLKTLDIDVRKLPLYEKIRLASALLVSIAEDSIGWKCNPGLCNWLHNMADELQKRCY
jgi:hypothetical protein